ncbi:inorganic phosphate transporter [Pseudoruegeria sp. SK021]|uniref:inorganic phosphate transporter n=1 Tax=Pseudoruegeria sp. SK021 TaxID=1933035 RepID=UPI000A24ADAE|nr:inorganic phosphate transporter [Pseudoruegeria sp. SK021]OSP55792.1 anion permease [Pseudoruegeria sp. SK021]
MRQTPDDPRQLEALDRELARYSKIELATNYLSRPIMGAGLALIFILVVGLSAFLAFGQTSHSVIVVIAACLGAYMALNVGANDVANNVGPAVGANVLTMGGAITIAIIFECAGALVAGGDVVETIANGILATESVGSSSNFIWAMLAALLSAALWVNLATWVGAPVSTTHSVVGAVMGAGIAAAGVDAVSWSTVGGIAASWVISPVLGGGIAAFFLWFVKSRIVYQEDKIAAARKWVPVLVGTMAGAFVSYLTLKGLQKTFQIDLESSLAIGALVGVVVWAIMIPVIRRQSAGLENRNKSLKILFSIPLMVSAALLCFAHGANDVANAVAPLAAIVHATQLEGMSTSLQIPAWVMVIGALGISFGLSLFGPKLIRMVGGQITKLNPIRAFCVAMSSAITVIFASSLGLPVSSTHIAVGGVFGVGFYREWEADRRRRTARAVAPSNGAFAKEERHLRKLVRRSHFMTIIAAWVITVPAAAAISAVIFLTITAR